MIMFFSIIYWFDDLFNLSFIFRFILQFCCGIILAMILLTINEYELNLYFFSIAILSGIINIFLSNVINFYDGLDLNISTLVIIFAITLIFKINFDIIGNVADQSTAAAQGVAGGSAGGGY